MVILIYIEKEKEKESSFYIYGGGKEGGKEDVVKFW